MAYELYKILEVSPQESADEIKRSYYRLVRKHPPEKDPEMFKALKEAFDTLSDPKARQNYDSLQEYGDQIQDLLDQAEERMKAEEWSSAIALLKRVLVLAPGANAARNRLGLCYVYNQQWDDAIKVYRTLTQDNPEVSLYWLNFGHVYKQQAECLDDEDYGKAKLYENARECFEKAVKLESFNSEPYLEIARTYLDEKNYSQALAWAERAISANGKADFHDFDTLFFICRVHLLSGELQNIEKTAQRIASLLPDSEDARRYAAYQFFNQGFELVKAGIKLASVGIWRAAFTFLKAARDFDPSDADLKDLYQKVEKMVAALEQYELLEQDSLIIHGFQRLAAFCLADVFSTHDSEHNRERLLEDIVTEILDSPSISIFSSLNRLKSLYPAVYGLKKELFDKVDEVAQELNTKQSGSPPPPLPIVIPISDAGVSAQPIQANPAPSGSSDWRNAVIIGSLIGGAIIIGFVLTRNPQISETPVTNNPTPIPTSPKYYNSSPSPAPPLSQEQAKDLIARWQQAKQRLFAPPYDQQLGAELTTGKAYKDNIRGPNSKGESESSLEWLQNNRSYYNFGLQRIDSVERFEAYGNEAVIEVVITEERKLHNSNGNIDQDASGLDTRLVRYSLQAENGKWKIADYKTLRIIR